MKPIKFDLPLNGTKIATLEQLKDNLSSEILDHFYSGKLTKWLQSRNLTEQSEAVNALLLVDNERELQSFKSLIGLFDGKTDEESLRVALAEHKKLSKSLNNETDDEIERLNAELLEAEKQAINNVAGLFSFVVMLLARKKKAISNEEFESWANKMIEDSSSDINEMKQLAPEALKEKLGEEFGEYFINIFIEWDKLINL